MKRKTLLLLGCLLSACAPGARHITVFGLTPSGETHKLAVPILLEPFDSAPAYTNKELLYRLAYADKQLHPYANSRWNTSPDAMLAAELRHAAGGKLQTLDQSRQFARCTLRIGLGAFEQVFTDQQNSHAELTLNFSLLQLRSRLVLGHDTLHIRIPAATANARGGALALQTASRQAAGRVIAWLNKLLASDSAHNACAIR